MKKVLLSIILFLPIFLGAQNIELHYDYGKDRNYFTSTIGDFQLDKYGATFFFFDINYNYQQGAKSASLGYLEIARYVKTPLDKFSATIQYNDGISSQMGPMGPTWLAGIDYPIELGFITLNTDLLYKTSRYSDAPDAQLTIIWVESFFNEKITFSGFFDVWTQDKSGDSNKKLVLLSEPQLWYNFNKHLSIGGEVEFSKNLLPGNNLEAKPTIAVKWAL